MAHATTYTVPELKGFWTMLFTDCEVPEDSQWALWTLLHDPDTVREGIAQLATKYRKLYGKMDAKYMVKFASSVMNRISRETSATSKENN
jgi:hypothetical protein